MRNSELFNKSSVWALSLFSLLNSTFALAASNDLNSKPIENQKAHSEPADKSAQSLATKEHQEMTLDEEFLLFLADIETHQGHSIDPLDMLSLDENPHQNTTLQQVKLSTPASPTQSGKKENK